MLDFGRFPRFCFGTNQVGCLLLRNPSCLGDSGPRLVVWYVRSMDLGGVVLRLRCAHGGFVGLEAANHYE